MSEMIREQMIAGALVRRHLRAGLDTLGVEWKEYKGLLESTFVITANMEQWALIEQWAKQFKRREDVQ